MEMNLDKLEQGLKGRIIRINAPEPLRSRLRLFGLTVGAVVCPCYRSPDGGVTALQLKATVVALPTKHLRRVRVELL